MGRSRSNTKRRPKGKRGWRKIDVDLFIKPQTELSLEEEKKRIKQLKDSQLWKQDIKPRRKKTKLQKKKIAKKKLLSHGFNINSIKLNNKLIKQTNNYNKKQRLLSFKSKSKCNPHPIQKKQTAIITFSNKTSKKIQLNNHQNIIKNKKNLKNNIDYQKNNKYHLYKTTHSKGNKTVKNKDLWNTEYDNKNNDNSAYLNRKNQKDKDKDVIVTNLGDIKPWIIIQKSEKAQQGCVKGRNAIPNKWVTRDIGVSLPNPGESINPSPHEYYYLKWKSCELKAKQLFKNQFQSHKTKAFYDEYFIDKANTEQEINKIKQNANKMKNLYLKHLKLHEKMQKKIIIQKKLINKDDIKENDDKNSDIIRTISNKEKKKEIHSNKVQIKKILRKQHRVRFIGRRLYGPKYRYKSRITPTMKSNKLNSCLRKSLHSGTDNVAQFVYHQLQRQNKIHGARLSKFVHPKKKGFWGPRWKVQTRIGAKLHHANVGKKYFKDLDN